MSDRQPELEDPVTQHLRTDYARLHVAWTVGEALAAIRARPPEGRIIYFYVLDDDQRLQGVVPTRRMLLSAPETPLRDILVRDVITIPATSTVLEVCEFFTLHRLLAFPVVDSGGKLLGIVDVELYTQEVGDLDRRAANDDLFQLIGVHLTEAQQASPVLAFRNRFPWLVANIAGGILSAFLSGFFADELQQAVALSLFIPVVLALAESVSIQSVSLALQSLRGKQVTAGTLMLKLRAELQTGLLLGTASASVVMLVALCWLGQRDVAVCILGGILGGVTFAAVIGAAMPCLLKLFHREPQVAAGPVALAATDLVTLLLYLMLARLLLR